VGITIPVLEASKIAMYQAMRSQGVSKSELGRRLHVHPPQVDRLLSVRHASQFAQVDSAMRALGKQLRVVVEDVPTLPVMRVARKPRAAAIAVPRGARPARARAAAKGR
jgi:antitoxin HicB